jgi:hypothetical protein
MPEYPQPGADQRSQQHFVIFDRFKGLNTQAARTGLPNDQLAWLENLQPIADNKMQVVPAAAQPAGPVLPSTVVLEFYAAMNNQDWLIFFTTAGGGHYYNVTTGASGQFAPNGTFSTAPDCTTWLADRILINDSVAGYCTWDGSVFVQQGGVSPNIQVTDGGLNYAAPPAVGLVHADGFGGVGAKLVAPGSWTGSPGAGNQPLTITASGFSQNAIGYATVVGPSPFSVASVTITKAADDFYNFFPSITLPVTGGTAPTITSFLTANGASAHADIANGSVVDIVLDNPGTGFAVTDTVEVVFGPPPTGSGAVVVVGSMSGCPIASITITGAGFLPNHLVNTNYFLSISAPPAGGTQAVAFATTALDNTLANRVRSTTITNAGAGYTVAPSVTFPPPFVGGEVAPTFTANMGNQSVTSLSLVSQGSGYPPSTTLPLVFSGGAGHGTGFVTTNGAGQVISATLTNGGSYPLGASVTITVSGNASTGAAASAHVWPFVPAGTTLAVFQGRVFLAGGQLLQWSGTGATVGYNNQGFDDFLVADLSGALQITDADLVHNITALRAFNNYLWVVGDQSIKQIGSLFPSGAPPFQLLTLSSDQGTIWPKSCISYNRIFLFANPNGIFGVFGSTVQKISDDLDGIFQNASFAQQVQGAIVDLNSKHNAVFMVRYNDPVAGTRSLLLVFDGKKWWFANQGAGLVAIATVPIFASDINQLWGSVTGTDVTHLLADPTTAVPFKLSTALAHADNPVQGKRLIRAGFTADASSPGSVNMLLEADNVALSRVFGVTATSLLVGGANDANNNPVTIAGVYLGATITGTLANFVLQNVLLEYQETSLWKGA